MNNYFLIMFSFPLAMFASEQPAYTRLDEIKVESAAHNAGARRLGMVPRKNSDELIAAIKQHVPDTKVDIKSYLGRASETERLEVELACEQGNTPQLVRRLKQIRRQECARSKDDNECVGLCAAGYCMFATIALATGIWVKASC